MMKPLLIVIGSDNYAAVRTNGVELRDENNNVLSVLAQDDIDNTRLEVLQSTLQNATSQNNSVLGAKHPDWWLMQPDHLRAWQLGGDVLENAETLTLTIRALIFGGEKPSVSTLGTTVSSSVDYNLFGW